MGRHGQRRANKPAVFAVSLVVMTGIAGCSASPSDQPGSAGSVHSAATASATSKATPTSTAATAIIIAGDHPVPPNGSQDTQAQTPGAGCDPTTFATDKALGVRIAAGFASSGLPVSAGLLTHFLQGTGAPVNYRAGSVISKQAQASAA